MSDELPEPIAKPVYTEREKRLISMDDAFRGVECPMCGFQRNTVLDMNCRCGYVLVNRGVVIGAQEERLPGGMTVGEAVKRARDWWERSGREYFRRQRARKGDSIAEDEELRNTRPVLMGARWDQLSTFDKKEVVKAWYNAWYGEQVAELTSGKGGIVQRAVEDDGEGENNEAQ